MNTRESIMKNAKGAGEREYSIVFLLVSQSFS